MHELRELKFFNKLPIYKTSEKAKVQKGGGKRMHDAQEKNLKPGTNLLDRGTYAKGVRG